MSSKRKSAPAEGVPGPRLLLTIKFLVVCAIGVACYLVWVSLGGMAVVGCGPKSNCGEVLHSRWAYWLGVPVSVPALAIYLTILAGTFRLGGKVPAPLQSKTWYLLMACAVTVLLAALWFVVLQIFVLKAVCPFCMAAHGLGSLAAILLLSFAPVRPAPEKSWQREKQIFVPPALAKQVALAALAGIALLVAGQTLHQRKTYLVKSVPAGVAVVQKAEAVRQADVFGGKFQINLSEAPLMGRTDALHVLVSLFDYTCQSCRTMHFQLKEAQKTFSNALAIVSLPMPMDPACNRTVTQTLPVHSNACEYARVGLAVWRANPKRLAEFDDWVFLPYFAPPLTQALQHAAQLVGTNAFQKALQDPWINEQIQRDVAIYEETYVTLGNGSMPQVIIGTNVTFGSFGQIDDLYRILGEQLGLKTPPKTNSTATRP